MVLITNHIIIVHIVDVIVDVIVTLECISLVFIIYCNPMFIPGCYHVMSCPDVPIGRINNVNKSCQVILGNPPIV